jgi:hypothetical protein
MKKILMPLLALMLHVVSAHAQQEKSLVISAGSLKHIAFGEKMKVVLVKVSPAQTGVNFTQEVSDKLNVSFTGNLLTVESRKASKNDIVYVVVNDLQSITLGQSTSITNEGIWMSGNIDLYVSDGAKARLKTIGEIKAHPLGESAVNVSIRPIPQNASAKAF